MVIIFLQDYRGVLSGEQFYQAGQEVDLPESVALKLVEAGRAMIKQLPRTAPKKAGGRK